jgi:hypothetical protein
MDLEARVSAVLVRDEEGKTELSRDVPVESKLGCKGDRLYSGDASDQVVFLLNIARDLSDV